MGVLDFMVIDDTCHLHDIWVSNSFPHKCVNMCSYLCYSIGGDVEELEGNTSGFI